jgi:hypothetical protein
MTRIKPKAKANPSETSKRIEPRLNPLKAWYRMASIGYSCLSGEEIKTLFLRKKRGFQLFSAKIRHFNSKKLGKTVVL